MTMPPILAPQFLRESETFLPEEKVADLMNGAQSTLLRRAAAGDCRLPNEPFPLLLGLVITATGVQTGSHGLACSTGALMAACYRADRSPDWTLRPEFRFTRAELSAALADALADEVA